MFEQLLVHYGYIGLFPLVVIEGPMITVFAGYLVFAGYFDFSMTLFTVILGDMLSDFIYYHIGYFANKSQHIQRYIAKKNFLYENLALLENLWAKHPLKTMFFGKQAYLICGPIVISSGVLKIGIGRFMLYSTPVSAFQALLLLTVGYYLGTGYMVVGQYIEYPAIIIAGVLIGLWYFYRRMRMSVSESFHL